jgi:hypothetical protein
MHGICAYPRAEACRRVAHFVPWRAAVKEQFGRLPVGPAKAPSARLCEIGNGQLRYAAPRLGAQDPVFVFEDHVGQKLWSLENFVPLLSARGFSLKEYCSAAGVHVGLTVVCRVLGPGLPRDEVRSSRSREGRVLFSPAQGDAWVSASVKL